MQMAIQSSESCNKDKHFVFVYGTLKRGHGNNLLLKDSTFISEGILHGHKLCFYYSEGSFPFAKKDERSSSRGEVYTVNEETLRRLDALEGYAPNRPDSMNTFYLRREADIETPTGMVKCFYYLGGANSQGPDCIKYDGYYQWSRY